MRQNMRFFALPLAAAAMCATAVPVFAKGSPIIIDYCHIDYQQGPNVTPSAAIALTKKSGPLEIKFTNESSKEATLVRFGVTMENSLPESRSITNFKISAAVRSSFFQTNRSPSARCSMSSLPTTPPGLRTTDV
jgi:hypothetical protein